MSEKQWIDFVEIKTKTKTKIFNVLSIYDKSKLGVIKWYPPYRKYAFFVTSEVTIDNERFGFTTFNADTKIFDTNCLNEIISFINILMKERNIK